MTERYVKQCLCQACNEKLINIKPGDFESTKLLISRECGKYVYAVSIGCGYLNMRWVIKDIQAGIGIKVAEWYIGPEFGGFSLSEYEYPSIVEWARRVVIRFETSLRLYSKRLGR